MADEQNHTLTTKLTFLEQKIDQHIQQNTQRLDQIIEIARQIATVNERQVRNQADIDDLRQRLNSESVSKQDSLNRIHARIDEVKGGSDDVKSDLHKWLNRGWGAWAAISIIFGALQYFINDSISAAKAANAEQAAIIKKMETRVNELETMATSIIANSRRNPQ